MAHAASPLEQLGRRTQPDSLISVGLRGRLAILGHLQRLCRDSALMVGYSEFPSLNFELLPEVHDCQG
jgi:hypothetical protein